MAIKFSQFTVGSTTSDIDYLVGYKNTDNIQIPVGLVGTNTTYAISTAQAGANETITLTGSDSSTDVITFTAGNNITLTDDGAGNGFTISSQEINEIIVTVQNVSGNNKYFIDGAQQQSLELVSGFTYRLDQSATTPSPGNSGHPLRFSTTSDGTHGGGVEYTTGVTIVGTPGTAGAYTQIIPEQDTPKLYYYCSVHPNMGGEVLDPRVVADTYTLPVTGSASAVTATLTGTGGDTDPVLITGGTNVQFSSITTGGFTIDATDTNTDTTYDLTTTTDGSNVDVNLVPSTGSTDTVKLTPSSGLTIAQTGGIITITNTEPNATHTGDVTGATALTIANDAVTTDKIINDAVTADKLADSINSEIAANTAKVTNATHTGEVTGATALTIASDVVDADNLKVTGNGTAGQALLSDGDGTFSWGSAGNTYTAGDGITLNTLEFDLDADLTTVTSIHNTGLKIGRGASDDYISFATDNQISSFIGNAEKMRLDSSFDLQVAGDVIAASTAFSDERLKENIKKIENPLKAIEQLNGVTYDWKANGKSSVGVIAQDVQKVFPELVKEVQPLEGDEKRLTVNYDGLIGVLIESVKELQSEVENLKNK